MARSAALDRQVIGPQGPARACVREGLTVELPGELVELVAQRVAAILAEREQSAPSPWLDTRAAAEWLCSTPDRVHDLVGLGKLSPRRDGRRLLFRRDDLDAYLEASA